MANSEALPTLGTPSLPVYFLDGFNINVPWLFPSLFQYTCSCIQIQSKPNKHKHSVMLKLTHILVQ
jgi:hypothetical protein